MMTDYGVHWLSVNNVYFDPQTLVVAETGKRREDADFKSILMYFPKNETLA